MEENYTAVLEGARKEFARKNTLEMARSSGAALLLYPPLSWREFSLPFLGRIYQVPWPTGEVLLYGNRKAAAGRTSLILLHYLAGASGNPATGKWLPFNQLSGGNSYYPAFKKKALDPLAAFFGKELYLFQELLESHLFARTGKEPHSFLLMALPRLPLLLRLNPGDNQAPARATLLFDSSANEYLPTEDLTAVSELLTARLLRLAKEGN